MRTTCEQYAAIQTAAREYLQAEPGDGRAELVIQRVAVLLGIAPEEAHILLADLATVMASENGAV